ncbi:MAG: ABC transporter substrate-binding protein [Verrucomicrobiae bacterium]|nr:ABC transporter substrate-binding protein [Verrucomicrobiae bacterium]
MILRSFHHRCGRGFVALALGFLVLGALGESTRARGDAPVSLQLKWYHQFQFAGYYAAETQGFFAEEGLEVEIIEGSPEHPPLERVLEGGADFGVSDSNILLARLNGKPVVACSVIFQHSPYVLISRADSGIHRPSDLMNQTIMVSGDQGSTQFLAMIRREGLPLQKVRLMPHSWKLEDLVEGKVGAISGYSTVEPSQLKAMGVMPALMRPSDYGVDFYGDTLFTTEGYAESHPSRVEAMIRATSRGWNYAMANPDKLIDHILTLPGVQERGVLRENLVYEAQEMRKLILPDMVEMGHMNPGRWLRMAESYQETGIAGVPENVNWMDGFMYREEPRWFDWQELALVVSLIAVIGVAAVICSLVLKFKVERKTRQVRKGKRILRAILDNSSNLMGLLSAEGHLIEVNQTVLDFVKMNREDLKGRAFWETAPWSETPELSQAIREGITEIREGGEGFRLEMEHADPEGEARLFHFEMRPVLGADGGIEFIVAEGIDITDQRKMGESLRQSQKMEAIGQLAGGVAHDFNNLLTVIQGHAAILLREGNLGGGEQAVSEILVASERASSLTKQLLAFSRQQPMQWQVLPVNECAAGVGKMLARLIGEHIELKLRLCDEPTLVRADRGMLEQVLLNLAVNARDAMPQGGLLCVETIPVSLEEGDEELPMEMAPGGYVRIDIRDVGEGIPIENLAHIFEPFYTTKEVGKGTGLGLATVFGIVEQHDGWVSVDSEVGRGSTFSVWLPRAQKEETEMKPERRAGSRGVREMGGSETILLVEDEKMVRMIAHKILTMHGYRVVEAISGRHALEVWKEHADEIDLVLTDIVMPDGISGNDLGRMLQQENPSLKVIYSSGYTADVFGGDTAFPDDAIFLGKPYLPEDLLSTVREALDDVALSA